MGGGIVGLMAAIRAGKLGAKAALTEEANTLRSGAGGTGNDHLRCYISLQILDDSRDAMAAVALAKGWVGDK